MFTYLQTDKKVMRGLGILCKIYITTADARFISIYFRRANSLDVSRLVSPILKLIRSISFTSLCRFPSPCPSF